MFTMNSKLILILLLWANMAMASERGQLLPPDLYQTQEELNSELTTELSKEHKHLQKIKYYLLNGETRLANIYLTKLTYSQSKYRPIIYRYNGMIKFIEGKFDQSLEYISRKEFNSENHYKKICTLKILNLIVLNKTEQILPEWERCQVYNIQHFKAGNYVWLETLVQLKTKRELGITQKPFRGLKLVSLPNDQLKLFLKLALYLNQEKLIEPQITELDLIQFSDPEVREIIGQMLFRLGMFARSYKFIEDLNAPNAENIKGNLYLLRDKYELAYAQFKLALEQKQNSQNAMERIIPLAWLLGDWSEGAKYAERMIVTPETLYQKLTLLGAFKIQESKFEEAEKIFDYIDLKSKRGTTLEVTQLRSFAGLMNNKSDKIGKFAELSCRQYDLLNCWLYFQNEHWPNYPTMTRRNDVIKIEQTWQKLTESIEVNELKEEIFINQIDIEELDNNLIKLIEDATK